MRGEQCRIYRYLDKQDCRYKYIGIAKNEFRLRGRIKEHKRDHWYPHGKWLIDYTFVESECDVQFLEGWLIGFYETGKYYNVSKTSWGTSKMFPMPVMEWFEYSSVSAIQKPIHHELGANLGGKKYVYTEEHMRLMCENWKLQSSLGVKQRECKRLRELASNLKYIVNLKNEELDRAYGKLKVVQDSLCATDVKKDFETSKRAVCIKGSSAVFKKRFAG